MKQNGWFFFRLLSQANPVVSFQYCSINHMDRSWKSSCLERAVVASVAYATRRCSGLSWTTFFCLLLKFIYDLFFCILHFARFCEPQIGSRFLFLLRSDHPASNHHTKIPGVGWVAMDPQPAEGITGPWKVRSEYAIHELKGVLFPWSIIFCRWSLLQYWARQEQNTFKMNLFRCSPKKSAAR